MILELLESHGITYQRVDHPPVFTCEDVRRLVPGLPGAETKNLFVRDGKGRRHFLVAVRPEKRVDLKRLGVALEVSGLRMASAERLAEFLGVETGAVTLLGAMNDTHGAVEVIIDEELWAEEAFQCHPLVNTSTFILTKEAITRFFEITGHTPRVIVVPAKV